MNYTFEVPEDGIVWSRQKGDEVELGMRIIATDKMRRIMDDEVCDAVERQVTYAIAKGIVDGGLIPLSLEVFKQRDPKMRATEYTHIVNGVFYPFILPKVLALQGETEILTKRLTGSWLRLVWRALRGTL